MRKKGPSYEQYYYVHPTKKPPGMYIGIALAVLALLIIAIVLIYCCCCKKKKEDEEVKEPTLKQDKIKTPPLMEIPPPSDQDPKEDGTIRSRPDKQPKMSINKKGMPETVRTNKVSVIGPQAKNKENSKSSKKGSSKVKKTRMRSKFRPPLTSEVFKTVTINQETEKVTVHKSFSENGSVRSGFTKGQINKINTTLYYEGKNPKNPKQQQQPKLKSKISSQRPD